MTTSVKAASLAPIPDPGFLLADFSTAGTIADKVGAALPDDVVSVIIQPAGAALEWRADGTTPTAGNGVYIADGEMQVWENQRALIDAAEFLGGSTRIHLFG